MFGYFKNLNWIIYICFLTLIILIFGVEIYFFKKAGISDGNFQFYIDLIQKIIKNNCMISKDAYPIHIYIILALFFSLITSFSLNTIGYFFIPLLSYIALGSLIYKNIIKNEICFNNNSLRDAFIIKLCIMLVGPITLFILFVRSAVFLIKEKNFRISKEAVSFRKTQGCFFAPSFSAFIC